MFDDEYIRYREQELDRELAELRRESRRRRLVHGLVLTVMTVLLLAMVGAMVLSTIRITL